MKSLVLGALALSMISTFSLAKNIYADIQVSNLESSNDFIWERKNKNAPRYPIELARSGLRGCAILSFDIFESGSTENVEVISSVPKGHLGKHARKMLKKWKWIPVSAITESEKRTIRLDFCIGGESTEQSQEACIAQTKLYCG